jgi:GNAT superfamily N-acetyltransferase
MHTPELVIEMQSYLRENARSQYECAAAPPFTLFFHPSSEAKYFNYGIPDHPIEGDLTAELRAARDLFGQRKRIPRFEFFEAFAPALPAALLKNGFHEEARQWSMICTPDDLRGAPAVPGLEIVALKPESPADDVADYLMAQRQGFQPENTTLPSPFDVIQARLDFLISGWQAFLARVDGAPAGTALFSRPIQGITEVAGIAVRTAFRRRGIATRLTWHTTQAAFRLGVHAACLTAADQASGRVYSRLGYCSFSNLLAFIDRETEA